MNIGLTSMQGIPTTVSVSSAFLQKCMNDPEKEMCIRDRNRNMYIGSGLNTVSSLYGQQKGNQMKTPASGEKTFYTAETPKVYQIFTTDNMSVSYTHLDVYKRQMYAYSFRKVL